MAGLAEIGAELDVLQTLHDFATELDGFTSRVGQYSGQDASALADDKTVQHALNGLKNAATELSDTLKEHDEVLGKGPGLAGQVNDVVKTVDTIAQLAAKGEAATGAEALTAMSTLLGTIPNLASMLTGLGSLNPVIGVVLGLYGTALQSAAATAEYLQGIQDHKADVIRKTDGINDDAEIIADAQPPPGPSFDAALDAIAARIDELEDQRIRLQAQADRNDLKRARDHCVGTQSAALADAMRAANASGSFPYATDADGNPQVDRSVPDRLDAFLDNVSAAAFDAINQAAAQRHAGRPSAEAEQRAEELMQLKAEVRRAMRPYNDCVNDLLEHGYQPVSHAGPAVGGMGAPGLARIPRGVLVGGAGLLAVAAVGIGIFVFGGNSPSPSPTTSPVAEVDTTDGNQATEPDAAAVLAGASDLWTLPDVTSANAAHPFDGTEWQLESCAERVRMEQIGRTRCGWNRYVNDPSSSPIFTPQTIEVALYVAGAAGETPSLPMCTEDGVTTIDDTRQTGEVTVDIQLCSRIPPEGEHPRTRFQAGGIAVVHHAGYDLYVMAEWLEDAEQNVRVDAAGRARHVDSLVALMEAGLAALADWA